MPCSNQNTLLEAPVKHVLAKNKQDKAKHATLVNSNDGSYSSVDNNADV